MYSWFKQEQCSVLLTLWEILNRPHNFWRTDFQFMIKVILKPPLCSQYCSPSSSHAQTEEPVTSPISIKFWTWTQPWRTVSQMTLSFQNDTLPTRVQWGLSLVAFYGRQPLNLLNPPIFWGKEYRPKLQATLRLKDVASCCRPCSVPDPHPSSTMAPPGPVSQKVRSLTSQPPDILALSMPWRYFLNNQE